MDRADQFRMVSRGHLTTSEYRGLNKHAKALKLIKDFEISFDMASEIVGIHSRFWTAQQKQFMTEERLQEMDAFLFSMWMRKDY